MKEVEVFGHPLSYEQIFFLLKVEANNICCPLTLTIVYWAATVRSYHNVSVSQHVKYNPENEAVEFKLCIITSIFHVVLFLLVSCQNAFCENMNNGIFRIAYLIALKKSIKAIVHFILF